MRYCEERGLSPEDVERARTMLAVREFMRRIEPHKKQAADLMALEPSRGFITSEGYVRADLSPAMNAALKRTQELIDMEAEKLGLVAPDR